VFGLSGRRGPTPEEVKAVQDACEQAAGGGGMSMSMMRHCRQCRADAVGLLGEDRGDEFAGDLPEIQSADGVSAPAYDLAGRQATHAAIEQKRAAAQTIREDLGISSERADRPAALVLVAVATSGGGVVNQHFGHADEFWIYETGVDFARLVGTRSVARYCHGSSTCDDDRSVLDRTIEMLSDCAAVLCSRSGAGPRRALNAAGIEVVEVYDQIEPAVARVGGRLAPGSAAGSAVGSAVGSAGALEQVLEASA
jgi:nitrogen fixation protein NifB